MNNDKLLIGFSVTEAERLKELTYQYLYDDILNCGKLVCKDWIWVLPLLFRWDEAGPYVRSFNSSARKWTNVSGDNFAHVRALVYDRLILYKAPPILANGNSSYELKQKNPCELVMVNANAMVYFQNMDLVSEDRFIKHKDVKQILTDKSVATINTYNADPVMKLQFSDSVITVQGVKGTHTIDVRDSVIWLRFYQPEEVPNVYACACLMIIDNVNLEALATAIDMGKLHLRSSALLIGLTTQEQREHFGSLFRAIIKKDMMPFYFGARDRLLILHKDCLHKSALYSPLTYALANRASIPAEFIHQQ
ncbi:MAG: hypothetical protein KatS3mg054_0026 [Chloroflexus sp.]|nr:MAG: hypothetical protein KatS3mg054_0026 [Chloroflexus sp.]